MKALTAGTILARAAGEGARHVAAARVGVVRLSGVSGSVRTLMLGAAALEAGRCLVVTAHERAASAIRQDLEAALAELAGAAGVRSPTLLSFPPLEADPYQGIAAHPRILAERAGTLAAIRRLHRWVVVTPLAALTAPPLPPEQFDALFLRLRSGEEFPFEALQLQLERAGYERVDLASSPGDWARRGGIFDIYPPVDPIGDLIHRGRCGQDIMDQDTEGLLDRQLESLVLLNIGGDEFSNFELLEVCLNDGMGLDDELFEHVSFAPSWLSDHLCLSSMIPFRS